MITTAENKTVCPVNLSVTTAAVAGSRRPGVRVWVTDDNALIRSAASQFLMAVGDLECEREFESAEDLLLALQAQPHPDVILMDIEMGGMSGVEALRPIRALAPGVRVLIMTAFFDPSYEKQAK